MLLNRDTQDWQPNVLGFPNYVGKHEAPPGTPISVHTRKQFDPQNTVKHSQATHP
jgi:hypothetical protein